MQTYRHLVGDGRRVGVVVSMMRFRRRKPAEVETGIFAVWEQSGDTSPSSLIVASDVAHQACGCLRQPASPGCAEVGH